MDDSHVLICSFCGYSTSRRYNLSRHTKTVHGHDLVHATQKVAQTAQKVAPTTQKVALAAQKVAPLAQEVAQDGEPAQHQCEKCRKTFTRRWCLLRHEPTCSGVSDPLTCPVCREKFVSKFAKHRHMVRGGCKAFELSCAEPVVPPSQTYITNHNTTYNNNTIHNNQTNVQLIINNFGDEDMSHVTPQLVYDWLMQKNGVGMFNFLKHVHLNHAVPENHNLREHPTKRKMIEVKKGGKWVAADCEDTLDKALRKYRCQMIARSGDPEFREKITDENEVFHLLQNHLQFGANTTPNDFYKIMRMFCAELLNFAQSQQSCEDE